MLSHKRPKKACQVKSNVKTMLICFFDAKGSVQKEIVPPWSNCQKDVLLGRSAACVKHGETKTPRRVAKRGVVISSRQCASAHRLECQTILDKKCMTPRIHPPYSPDLAPCDLFLVPRMKKTSRETISTTLIRLKQKRRWLCKTSPCKSSRAALRAGKRVCIGALSRRESTSKMT